MDLALFDFDGTITHKDSFLPFLFFASDPNRVRLGKVLLIPVALGYKLRVISASTTRELVAAFSLRGKRYADIQRAGQDFAMDFLPGIVRQTAVDRIAWHKERGDTVVIVSAALSVYLSPWCASVGIDLVSTELEVRHGVVTGRYLGGDCVGHEKARRVREKYNVNDFGTVFAYGDTSEDRALLDMADRKSFRWQEVEEMPSSNSGIDRMDLNPDR